jgi:hypothetical protein
VAARLLYLLFPLKWHGNFAATNTDTATNMKPAQKQYLRLTQQEANQHDNKISNSQKTVCQTDNKKSN